MRKSWEKSGKNREVSLETMAKVAIGYGALLVVLGIGGYFASGRASVTALIPAGFGVLVLGCGAVALKEKFRKHAMHAAVVLGVLGVGGSARGLLKLPALLRGGDVARPAAVIAQSVMFLLSLVFVALCVRSFIVARLKRAR